MFPKADQRVSEVCQSPHPLGNDSDHGVGAGEERDERGHVRVAQVDQTVAIENCWRNVRDPVALGIRIACVVEIEQRTLFDVACSGAGIGVAVGHHRNNGLNLVCLGEREFLVQQ